MPVLTLPRIRQVNIARSVKVRYSQLWCDVWRELQGDQQVVRKITDYS